MVAVHLYTEAVLNCRVGMLKDKTVSYFRATFLSNILLGHSSFTRLTHWWQLRASAYFGRIDILLPSARSQFRLCLLHFMQTNLQLFIRLCYVKRAKVFFIVRKQTLAHKVVNGWIVPATAKNQTIEWCSSGDEGNQTFTSSSNASHRSELTGNAPSVFASFAYISPDLREGTVRLKVKAKVTNVTIPKWWFGFAICHVLFAQCHFKYQTLSVASLPFNTTDAKLITFETCIGLQFAVRTLLIAL